MSASLLQKSLKLIDENKELKKKSLKKKKLQNYKWRSTSNSNEKKDKNTEDNILENIRKLKELDRPVFSLETSEKIFSRRFKRNSFDLANKKEEEKTVFTDKDFEEFEKEYLAS